VPLRGGNPVISYFGEVDAKEWGVRGRFGKPQDFIVISFTSSQSGILRKRDGKFFYLGQD
jgi:hypothetical protein